MHKLADLGAGEGIFRHKIGRNIFQNRPCFCQNSVGSHKRGHPALGIYVQIGLFALRAGRNIDQAQLIFGTQLF